MLFELDFSEIEVLSAGRRMALASACAEKSPRAALRIWETLDFKTWDPHDPKATRSNMLIRTRSENGIQNPLEVFAEKGMLGPLMLSMAILKKKNPIDLKEVVKRVLISAARGCSEADFRRLFIRMMKSKYAPKSEMDEASMAAYGAGKLETVSLLNGYFPMKKYVDSKTLKWHLTTYLSLDDPFFKLDNIQLNETPTLRKISEWAQSRREGRFDDFNETKCGGEKLLRSGATEFFNKIGDLAKKIKKGMVCQIPTCALIALFCSSERTSRETKLDVLSVVGAEKAEEAARLALGCLAGSGDIEGIRNLITCCGEMEIRINGFSPIWREGPSAYDVLLCVLGDRMPKTEEWRLAGDLAAQPWLISGVPKKEGGAVSLVKGVDLNCPESVMKGYLSGGESEDLLMSYTRHSRFTISQLASLSDSREILLKNQKTDLSHFRSIVESMVLALESEPTEKQGKTRRI